MSLGLDAGLRKHQLFLAFVMDRNQYLCKNWIFVPLELNCEVQQSSWDCFLMDMDDGWDQGLCSSASDCGSD